MPAHAHGQGYTDVNFLIPELIEEVRYRKGTYYADQGNFSAAGSVDLLYRHTLPAPVASPTVGEDNYHRALLAGSAGLGGGSLLAAVDYSSTDGPWDLAQDFRKLNGLVKYTRGDDARGLGVTAVGYDGDWRSTDQIPRRAVRSGDLSRFGFVDATDGGDSHRYSLSLDVWSRTEDRGWAANAYAVDYGLNLFLQFHIRARPGERRSVRAARFTPDLRRERRGRRARVVDRAAGRASCGARGAARRHRPGRPAPDHRAGAPGHDPRGYRQADGLLGVDHAAQSWTGWLRAELGVRADYLEFDVVSDLAANSGRTDDSIVSPKLGVTLGPWNETELFLNYGRGFHSNDARGTTIRVDPVDGVTPVQPVDPLVAATGVEIGLRTAALPGLELAMSVWTLTLDSELLFVGDGGTTEASRKSRRSGIELGAFWTPLDWLVVDLDLAWSRARMTLTFPCQYSTCSTTMAAISRTFTNRGCPASPPP